MDPVVQAVKKLTDELEQTFEKGRVAIDEKTKETLDAKSAEVLGIVEKAAEATEAKFAELEENQKKLNAAIARKQFENVDENRKAIRRKSFEKIRQWYKDSAPGASFELKDILGDEHMKEEKSLSVGDDTQAGYAVKPQMEAMIDATITEQSMMRQFANVVTISNSDHIERLVNQKGGVGATRGGTEHAAPTDTGNPTLSESKIYAHFMDAEVVSTQQMLEDGSFDIESWFTGESVENMAVLSQEEYILGGGSGRAYSNLEARGILTYPDGTAYGQIEQVASGASGAFTTNSLLELVGSQKEAYQGNSRFICNRITAFKDLYTLQDAEDRNYLVANWHEGVNFRLLGFPIHFDPNMPVAAADSLSLVFGNFQRAYTIVDRTGLVVQRDPYTAYPKVRFKFRKRTGGDVENFEALKILKLG